MKDGILSGKISIVTGGASGIGAATARTLAKAGARVALFDIDGATAATVASGLPDAASYAVDVADADSVFRAFAAAQSDFGGLDILVNSAGIGTATTIMDMTVEDWGRVLDVNLSGVFYCLKGALPALKEGGGSVINIASIAGKRISYHGGANYTAAKSGLLGLTRHAAFELAQFGIRVNAICPGPVLTPMVEAVTTAEDRANTAGIIPLGEWVRPDDIADMALFLAGPGSAKCTGASFDVDGGMLVSNGTPYADYLAHRNRESKIP